MFKDIGPLHLAIHNYWTDGDPAINKSGWGWGIFLFGLSVGKADEGYWLTLTIAWFQFTIGVYV